MFHKTEKKLENLDNDVVSIEAKMKEYAEKLRLKKEKREETMKSAIVELVRENNLSLTDLKSIIGDIVPQTVTQDNTEPRSIKRKLTKKATDEVVVENTSDSQAEPTIYGKETYHEQEID